jgi:HAD superfamily hydrolase (TIGR01509 family)
MNPALLFDLDGVLIDTEPLKYESYRKALEQFSISLKIADYRRNCVGLARHDLCNWLVTKYNIPVSANKLSKIRTSTYRMLLSDAKPLNDGVNLVKKYSHLLSIAVVSSTSEEFLTKSLSMLGISKLVKLALSADDVKKQKPAPDPYLLALNVLNLPASICVAIEDTAIGVKAAKSAGLRCIARPSISMDHNDLFGADLIVNSLYNKSVFEFIGFSDLI